MIKKFIVKHNLLIFFPAWAAPALLFAFSFAAASASVVDLNASRLRASLQPLAGVYYDAEDAWEVSRLRKMLRIDLTADRLAVDLWREGKVRRVFEVRLTEMTLTRVDTKSTEQNLTVNGNSYGERISQARWGIQFLRIPAQTPAGTPLQVEPRTVLHGVPDNLGVFVRAGYSALQLDLGDLTRVNGRDQYFQHLRLREPAAGEEAGAVRVEAFLEGIYDPPPFLESCGTRLRSAVRRP